MQNQKVRKISWGKVKAKLDYSITLGIKSVLQYKPIYITVWCIFPLKTYYFTFTDGLRAMQIHYMAKSMWPCLLSGAVVQHLGPLLYFQLREILMI